MATPFVKRIYAEYAATFASLVRAAGARCPLPTVLAQIIADYGILSLREHFTTLANDMSATDNDVIVIVECCRDDGHDRLAIGRQRCAALIFLHNDLERVFNTSALTQHLRRLDHRASPTRLAERLCAAYEVEATMLRDGV